MKIELCNALIKKKNVLGEDIQICDIAFASIENNTNILLVVLPTQTQYFH